MLVATTNLPLNSKYLDSHLKPYHCKIPQCQETRFSSTACLLRHEREAHGMHGHGSKPHTCHFPDCDRYENGFPRRWNLYDHMRRVHNYSPPPEPQVITSSSSQTHSLPSPSPSPTGGSKNDGKKMVMRKRKTSNGSATAEPMKKTRSVASSSHSQAQQRQAYNMQTQQLKDAETKWSACRSKLEQQLKALSPEDADGYTIVNATFNELHSHATRYRKLQAGTLGSMKIEY